MLLEKNRFFIKQQVQMLKLSKTYDILDPETSRQIAVAKEEPNPFIKVLKVFTQYRKYLPTKVKVYEDNKEVFMIKKPISIFGSKVAVLKSSGECLGYFRTKFFIWNMWKKLFYVHDAADRLIGEVQTSDPGEFKLVGEDGKEVGIVTKKWGGAAKELLTSADNYLVAINDKEKQNPDSIVLMLAAGLAIDLIYKGNLVVAQK